MPLGPKQDINRDKGPIWIQVLNSAGKMNIGFDAISVLQEKLDGWEEWADDPVNDSPGSRGARPSGHRQEGYR